MSSLSCMCYWLIISIPGFKRRIEGYMEEGSLFKYESRESENIKTDNGFGTDADERIEKLNFLPLVPLLFVGFSF